MASAQEKKENLDILRVFSQVAKRKRDDPNIKDEFNRMGHLTQPAFRKVVVGPLLNSKKTRTDADIYIAVGAWIDPTTRAEAETTYGHISDWETSHVTNMERLFCGNIYMEEDPKMHAFNDDISRWDTSNVTTMEGMFNRTNAFNGDLSRWDTSNVTNMGSMFGFAYAFNGDLSRWDTSNVTTMRSMFFDARAFNGDLSRWDTSNVTTMAYMFHTALLWYFYVNFSGL